MLLSGSHKPQKVNHVKHILILLSLLILTFPLVAQETGVLYLKKVNGKVLMENYEVKTIDVKETMREGERMAFDLVSRAKES